MNESLAFWLNSLAQSNFFTLEIAVFLAVKLAYVLVGILIYFLYKSSKKIQEKHFHTLLFAIGSGLFARYLLKESIVYFFKEARPYIADPGIKLLISPLIGEEYQSFPSGHALFFFAVSTALYLHHKKLGSIFFVSSILMGIGRVMVGAHYPLDIIAGALLGMMTAYLLSLFLEKKRFL